MTLRLAWAGPWNQRSAIAAFGAQIVAELSALGMACGDPARAARMGRAARDELAGLKLTWPSTIERLLS